MRWETSHVLLGSLLLALSLTRAALAVGAWREAGGQLARPARASAQSAARAPRLDTGPARVPRSDTAPARPPDARPPTEKRLPEETAPQAGEEVLPCRRPALAVPKTRACERGRPYPRCRWQIPTGEAARTLYRIWRNTTPEHRWGRPGLVSLLLGVAARYRARYPDDRMSIGDLDAPGPRHQTHRRGVNADLYLEAHMMSRNVGGGRYPDNYAGRSRQKVASMRARVLYLAQSLARCTDGQISIYYNDPEVIERFNAWFQDAGLESPFGPPMRAHNRLHRFHFHITVPDDLPLLPR